MAGISRFYKKNIAEGTGFLIFSVLLAVAIRSVYLFGFNFIVPVQEVSYLWKPISFLFNDTYISLLASSLMTGSLALLVAHINTKHLLIRHKSLLPPAIIILMFSSHPSFIFMSGEYISALLTLVVIDVLFSAYHSEQKQYVATKASFILALSSLFTPVSLIYFPVLWIALGIIRCFDFKAFLASLLGIFIVYFPAFSFYLLTDNLDIFLEPFLSVSLQDLNSFSLWDYSIFQWIVLGFFIMLMVVVIVDNYLSRHKDKIRIRAYMNLLLVFAIFSLLAFLFFNLGSSVHLYICFAIVALLLAHFFALGEQRMTEVLFYLSLIFYTIVSFLLFLHGE